MTAGVDAIEDGRAIDLLAPVARHRITANAVRCWPPLLGGCRGCHRAALRRCAPSDGALWVLAGRAAMAVGDAAVLARARDALAPAAGELAGAGSGMLTAGPADHLAEWDRHLGGGRAEPKSEMGPSRLPGTGPSPIGLA